MDVSPIPAFDDNYIWLLRDQGGRSAAIVDPGDEEPVLTTLAAGGLTLTAILVTHHHFDHIGGVDALRETYPEARVFGPKDRRIRALTDVVGEGDKVQIPGLSDCFRVLEVPGHTSSHIAFFGHGCLFCGDTLFSVGCGRLFEGTPEQMQASMDQIAALPPETRVFCAHEYTLGNCDFALAVEPENRDLQRRASEVEARRATGHGTVPSLLGEELAVNPFLRTREPAVVAAARGRNPAAAPGASTLAEIRAWKDAF